MSRKDRVLKKIVLLLVSGLALTLSSCSNGPSAEELRDGIRTFAYDERIACEAGSDACFDRLYENTHPDLRPSPTDIARLKENGYWAAAPSPDLDTIEKDSSWVRTVLQCVKDFGWLKDDVDYTKPLRGDTYVLEAGDGDSKYSFHMTYLDGKWYDHFTFCND